MTGSKSPIVDWWMSLGAAAGALVLFNIVIVVLVATMNRSEADPDEDLAPW
jgi:hypothetical protein